MRAFNVHEQFRHFAYGRYLRAFLDRNFLDLWHYIVPMAELWRSRGAYGETLDSYMSYEGIPGDNVPRYDDFLTTVYADRGIMVSCLPTECLLYWKQDVQRLGLDMAPAKSAWPEVTFDDDAKEIFSIPVLGIYTKAQRLGYADYITQLLVKCSYPGNFLELLSPVSLYWRRSEYPYNLWGYIRDVGCPGTALPSMENFMKEEYRDEYVMRQCVNTLSWNDWLADMRACDFTMFTKENRDRLRREFTYFPTED